MEGLSTPIGSDNKGNELLKKNKLGNGTFEPKKLKREKIKEVLLSFRYNYNNSENLEKFI